jgi:phosphate transport system substrate-binding protein
MFGLDEGGRVPATPAGTCNMAERTRTSPDQAGRHRAGGSVFSAPVVLAALTVTLLGLSMPAFLWWQDSRRPTFARAGQTASPASPTRDVPTIAGTGAAFPVLTMLASEFERSTGTTIAIAPSIGSGGGLRALADGAIDCAIVSRAVAPDEFEGRLITFAQAPVVIAAGVDVPVHALTGQELIDLYTGKLTTWPNGPPVGLLLREPGDSGTRVFEEHFPAFADAHAQAARSGLHPVLLTELAMQRALLDRPRSVGVFDYPATRFGHLPLVVLAIDGLHPEADGAAAQYPLVRPLSLVLPRDVRREIADFADFVTGAQGRGILEAGGCLPVEVAGAQ